MTTNVPNGSSRPFALIIEDDRDIAALFRHVLDLAGFITEIVLDGNKAVERLNVTAPELILLDLNLSGMSGVDIFARIRSDYRHHEANVIVITGYPHMAVELENQAELILQKPISIDHLSIFVSRFYPERLGTLQEHPYDETTQLYNRKFFENRLSHSIEHLNRLSGDYFGILFVDCDNYNLVQRRGVEFSNQILAAAAKVLKKAVRPYDTVSYFDSGQFFIQVDDLPSKDVLFTIAQRIHQGLTARIMNENSFEITANLGMVFCGSEYKSPDEIVRDADIAMFYAKSNPYTNLVIFDPIKHGAFRSQEKYAAIKRAGLQNQELI